MNITNLVTQTSDQTGYPRWSETLLDRSQVLVRPISKHDHEAERAFLEGLSSQARHFRFLGQVRTPSERMIKQFTEIDQAHEAAFVALVPASSGVRIVGVSRYCADDSGNCECAVTVADAWQDKGLGTVLMKHLIEVARARGIHRMTSLDSVENSRMKEMARHLGFHVRIDPDDASQVIHELEL
jgi:GNAT superfamily N-acetyltransferase